MLTGYEEVQWHKYSAENTTTELTILSFLAECKTKKAKRLTSCSKPRACSCQQQAGRASQMLTYNLFKT
jgi:hypothetical protein